MKKFKFEDFTIIVDTREQKPWVFDNSKLGTLKTGDYSIEGYEDRIGIERKSTDDFAQSIGKGRTRFMKEMERAKRIKHFCIIIEGSWYDLFVGNYRAQTLPASAIGTAMSIMAKYQIPVILAETRKQAQTLAQKFLRFSLMEEYKEKDE